MFPVKLSLRKCKQDETEGNRPYDSHVLSSYKPIKKIDTLYTGGKVGISPDGVYLITTCHEKIKGTEISTGNLAFTLVGDTELVTSWALRPNGLNVMSASRSLMLYLWDLPSGQSVKRMRGHDQPILVMDFDSTGMFLGTGAADGTVRVWDIEGGFCTHHFKGHRGVITALKFHPDMKQWLVCSASEDGQIRIWNLLEKSCVTCFEGHMSSVRALDVSLCGEFLMSISRDKMVYLWNLRKKTLEKMMAVMESLEGGCFVEDHSNDFLWQTSHDVAPLDRLYVAIAGEKGRIRIFHMSTSECVFTQEASSHHTIPSITQLM
jgi:U3 small nucleolar RNA-associated protein 13